jgi:hypothetical protein
MVHTQTTLAPAARGKGAVAAQGRAQLDDYAPGRSPRLRGLPAAPSPSARWLPGRGYHGWLSRLTPYRRQHSLKSLNETVPYPYSRGDSVMSQRATQSSTKAAPKQCQSSAKTVPKQYQSSTKAVPEQYQSSTRAVPEQYQSSTRAVPEQYQSSTRAVQGKRKNRTIRHPIRRSKGRMDYVPRGMPSMMRYYSTCRRWAGSTLT